MSRYSIKIGISPLLQPGDSLRFLLLALLATMALFPALVGAANSENVCSGDQRFSAETIATSPYLRFVSLNLAHGRGDGINQLLKGRGSFEENLTRVAEHLGPLKADAIAFQEADAPSRWSGKFDHLEFLTSKMDYSCYLHGYHAKSFMYLYGTALLSRHPLGKPYSHTFTPSWPTTNKGYVSGTLLWNPGGNLEQPMAVTVVSVHFDFSRRKVRHSQAREMIKSLSEVEGPFILMGDLNTDSIEADGVLQMLVSELDLQIYKPKATGMGTYISRDTRLDWILISNEFQYKDYHVVQQTLSDHYPISVDVELMNDD